MSRFMELTRLVRDINQSSSIVKKKTVDLLKEVLNDNETILVLNRNSSSRVRDNLDWDALFTAVHGCLLKVEENRRKKETTTLVNLSLQCSSLMTFIVKKACLNHPRIHCSSIVQSFLDVMAVNYLKNNIGNTYIDILKFVLLSHRKYRSDMSHELWKDIFMAVSKLYQAPPSHVEHLLVVEILNIIVMHGSCQSNLSGLTKGLYSLMKITFQDNQFCRSKFLHQERLLQLSVTLCSQTSHECRTALCQFGEEVICSLICMYDKLSLKGKSLLHDFLLLQLHGHHPGGSPQNSLCSYAFDWKEWNVCLDSMYHLILAEIDRPMDKRSKHITSTFLQLAVEVCQQVFNRTYGSTQLNENDGVERSVAKRRKLDVGIMTLVESVQTSQDSQVNLWFVLSLISTFVRKYPKSLKEKDFISLLEYIAELQSKNDASKTDALIEHTCLCCISLLKAEEHFKTLDMNTVDSLWDKIWITTVRTLGWNQNEKNNHYLLQALILHDKAKNLVELTKYYVDNTFQVCQETVLTLCILLENYDLSALNYYGAVSASGYQTMRNSFLEWLLSKCNIEVSFKVSPCTLSRVLTQLSSKTVHINKLSSNFQKTEKSTFDLMAETMDKDYFISSFMTEEMINDDLKKTSPVSSNTCIDVTILDNIQKLLIRRGSAICDSLDSDNFSKTNLVNALYHLSALIEAWKVFYNVLPQRPIFCEAIDVLVNYISRQVLRKLKNVGSCAPDLANVFKELQLLLLRKQPNHIGLFLCDSEFMYVVKHSLSFVVSEEPTSCENDILEMDDFSSRGNKLEDTLSSTLDDCFNIEHYHFPQISIYDLSENQKLYLECLKFLGCFLTLGNGKLMKVNEVADEILNSVPLIDLHSVNGVAWIIQCLIDNEVMEPSVVSSVLIQLKNLFSAWLNDSEVALIVMRLMRGMVQHVHNSGAEREKGNFIVLMNGILKCIAKNKFGVKVSVGYIKCLETIAKVDPSASWARSVEGPLAEKILIFLDNSSHEVRLSAIAGLKILFSESVGFMDDTWHWQLFSDMCEAIDQFLIVEGNLGECSVIDEAANRSASALHAFLAVLIGSPILHKHALFRLLKFCKQKKLSVDLFKRALSFFGKTNNIYPFSFIARNLPFVAREWLESNLPLKDLATYLNQSSVTSFYESNKNVLVPILILRDDTTTLNEMGMVINQNVTDMIKDCFPLIMGELLPGLEAEEESASQCEKQLERIISRDCMETLLSSTLPQVIVTLFKKVHDPTHFKELTKTRVTMPHEERSNISFNTAMKCMKYIQRGSPSPERNMLELLCEICPSHIQRILLDLTSDIYEAILLQDKLVSFYHYIAFVSVLATGVSKNSSLIIHSYIICCTVQTLTHLIKSASLTETSLAIAACHFLKYFCELNIPQNIDIIRKLIVLMTDALVDALPKDSAFQEMQNFIVTNLKNVRSAPNLEDEISSFLEMRYLSGKQGVESLKHIHHQLSIRKDELKSMYDKLHNSRGFSEDCSKSLLHRLVCRFIEIATTSELEVSIQAGRCLGEIGPSDLGTLVLQPDAGLPVTEVFDLAPIVAEYLLNENISAVKCASQAMYSLLKYKECNKYAVKQVTMSCGILCKDYLYPFTMEKKLVSLSFEINESISVSQICDENLWCPKGDIDHESWVVNLTITLLDYISKGDNFLPDLIPLCKEKASFSAMILPLFVSKLTNLNPEFGKIIVKCIEKFFDNHVRLSKTSDNLQNVCLNKASVQCMLNLVHFLRIHDSLKNKNWNPVQLELNYLNIAQAAQFCNAHFSSLLYIELWRDKWLRSENLEDIYGQSQSVLERINEKEPEIGCIAQQILWEVYVKICDTDAIYGCGSSLLLDPNKRTLHYELRGQWEKVILSHDVQLSSGYTESRRGLVHALQKAGLQHILDVYLSSISNDQCSADLQYECAWRLAKWDTQLISPHSHQGNFEQFHFMALRALSNYDKIGLEEALSNAHKCVSESLVNISLESCKSIYKILSQFQQIQEIVEFDSIREDLEFDNLFKKWIYRDEISFNQFEEIEPVYWQRIVMLNSSNENGFKQKAAEIAALLASLAREKNQLQVTAKCLGSFNVCKLPSKVSGLLKIEEARLAWCSGDLALGKRILRDLLSTFNQQNISTHSPVMYAQALKLYGDWLVETKSENPQVVIDRYYLRALQILNDVGDCVSENVLDIYSTLAHFADGHYQNLSNYFKTRTYEIKKQCVEKAEHDIEILKNQPNRSKDDDRTLVIKQKQCRIDKEEITNTAKQKDKYLVEAVKYYLRCLEYGDRNNLDIFRVASLWLENMLHPSLKVILDENLFQVPSYKFVPILPQLTPRISNVKDDFTIKLQKLLVLCAEDHPYHALPIILALANSHKDQDFTGGVKSSQKRTTEARVLGAQQLVHKLSKSPIIGELLKNMNEVSFALISMAYLNPEHGRGIGRLIPENEPLRKLKNMVTVPVPTLALGVEKSCKYSNIIGIAKYDASYSLVGGINAPKKLVCVGTDGLRRLQLIKGKDDLRQDAVMQQVFTIMNSFLQKNKDTSRRKLQIRTYKVVPLSQRSGVIEWCENTLPLLVYLTGTDHKSGAHGKYCPNDETSIKCREIMKSVSMKSSEAKLEAYKKICNSLHPVLRYFFLERFTSPGMWFERREAYTHSVATSSMIGYILGLGDRHLMNILIDESTAEVIHIDFGIAFEMGQILPTPETVPFRLTRDIVDAMGVSGAQGIFQRSCEKTLSVLREHQTILLTVLEVLLYDPLYAWTITPSKAYKVQKKDVKIVDDNESIQVNRMAERALQRLEQKLVGTEVGAGVSVPTQVCRLIQDASDPGNLSLLFCGWEPYL